MTRPHYLHANALVIGEAGILLRGPSRSGKSTLTRELVALAQAQGQFASLVGDDRVSVEATNGRVIARPHPTIAGLIEARGTGIVAMPHAPACTLRLVVDLVTGDARPPRRLENPAPPVEIAGVELPRIVENALSDAAPMRITTYIQMLMTK